VVETFVTVSDTGLVLGVVIDNYVKRSKRLRNRSTSRSKYERFGGWFVEGHKVWMPDIGLVDGHIAFSDGRHRFAWFRDHGVKAMPVTVSSEIKAEITRRFGTKLRRSHVSEFNMKVQ
jgi:uncharacterized protein (DUF362 family)